jgi:hypothetical protein
MLIVALSCFSQFIIAQIVYVDVNPDEVVSCSGMCIETYFLDLNNDGIDDFLITAQSSYCASPNWSEASVSVAALSGNGVPMDFDYPQKLSWSDSVSSSSPWGIGGILRKFDACDFPHSAGGWQTTPQGYLGLRLQTDSNVFYGWARLSVNSSSSFTLYDYAFDSIPDELILAGDSGQIALTVQNPFNQAALRVFPNPTSSSTAVSFSLSNPEKISLRIYEVQGRLIRTLANENMSKGTHTLTWDARDENGNAVSEGIYFLRMETVRGVNTIAISVAR